MSILNEIIKILTNTNTRLILWLSIISLHLICFMITPQRFSLKVPLQIPYRSINKGWRYKYFTYNDLYPYFIRFIILLDIAFFYYIYNTSNLHNSILPKMSWILLLTLSMFIINNIHSMDNPTKKTNTFSPPYNYLLNIKKRTNIFLFTFIIFIIHFLIELLLIKPTLSSNNPNIQHNPNIQNNFLLFILTKFTGFYNNKLLFTIGWSRCIGLLINLYILYTTYSFAVCRYKLPDSWDT